MSGLSSNNYFFHKKSSYFLNVYFRSLLSPHSLGGGFLFQPLRHSRDPYLNWSGLGERRIYCMSHNVTYETLNENKPKSVSH